MKTENANCKNCGNSFNAPDARYANCDSCEELLSARRAGKEKSFLKEAYRWEQEEAFTNAHPISDVWGA